MHHPILIAGLLLATPVAAETIVPVAPFTAIQLRSGGHVVLKHGAVQRVRILAGEPALTDIHLEGPDTLVIATACAGRCPPRYRLDIEITTPVLTGLAITGGGAIESAGAFPEQGKLSLAVEGGGRIDTRSIDSATASAAVQGGGDIAVRAHDTLNAVVEGGGHIGYWGPARVARIVTGGGHIARGG